MPPDSANDGEAVVKGDPSMRWRYLAVWALLGLPLLPLVLVCGLAAGAFPSGDFWPVFAITFGLWILWSLAFCIAWTYTSAATSYRCDGSKLVAVRRGHVIRSIDCDDIASMKLVNTMGLRRVMLDLAPPPEWPSATVELKGPHQGVVQFPEIMIWGRSALQSAEQQLRAAISSKE